MKDQELKVGDIRYTAEVKDNTLLYREWKIVSITEKYIAYKSGNTTSYDYSGVLAGADTKKDALDFLESELRNRKEDVHSDIDRLQKDKRYFNEKIDACNQQINESVRQIGEVEKEIALVIICISQHKQNEL